MENTYSIIRFYKDSNKENETIETGLSLEEARKHCNSPESSEKGVWFDGYREE